MGKLPIRATLSAAWGDFARDRNSIRALFIGVPLLAIGDVIMRYSGSPLLGLITIVVVIIFLSALAVTFHKLTLQGPTTLTEASLYDGEWKTTLLYALDATLLVIPFVLLLTIPIVIAGIGERYGDTDRRSGSVDDDGYQLDLNHRRTRIPARHV
jgi:hypothetical protein